MNQCHDLSGWSSYSRDTTHLLVCSSDDVAALGRGFSWVQDHHEARSSLLKKLLGFDKCIPASPPLHHDEARPSPEI